MSHAGLFSRFLGDGRLHFAAHSHHPWPDVTFEAQQQAWLDAAELMDGKWGKVMGEVVPEAQRHVAARLGLPDPSTVAFAPNTHELVFRLVSALRAPVRVLTTDGEFHSFRRQLARWEEARRVAVTRVPVEPFDTFPYRFLATARSREHDLTYISHVFYDSGYVIPDLDGWIRSLPPEGHVIVDGYHGFMALPTRLDAVWRRVFYVAGGYKYAMAGEGAAFMHCPPGVVRRPIDTGWYAGFGDLEDEERGVGYPQDAGRFWGATFDPTGLYRFNAAQRVLDAEGIDVGAIHRHVAGLQQRFLEAAGHRGCEPGELLPPARGLGDRGHFLTYRTPGAEALTALLGERGVTVDRRADRLRIGFGIYHDSADVDRLVGILGEVLEGIQATTAKETA